MWSFKVEKWLKVVFVIIQGLWVYTFAQIWRTWMLAGVEFVGGDMFTSVPSGDAIFMKVSNQGSYVKIY